MEWNVTFESVEWESTAMSSHTCPSGGMGFIECELLKGSIGSIGRNVNTRSDQMERLYRLGWMESDPSVGGVVVFVWSQIIAARKPFIPAADSHKIHRARGALCRTRDRSAGKKSFFFFTFELKPETYREVVGSEFPFRPINLPINPNVSSE
jgi:hypothetical protein